MEKTAVYIPKVLLPPKTTDMSLYAVVACDQFTSQPEYWNKVEEATKGVLSAYHLILPEIYLEEENVDSRIRSINSTMSEYIDNNIFTETEGFILVRRTLSDGKVRDGLIIAVDLEQYNFSKGTTALIRATEGTVLERIPPRLKIRKNALLELPHTMLLVDDPSKTVIEPLTTSVANMQKLYDFELMMYGGHIQGYLVNDKSYINNIYLALDKLLLSNPGFLFAVGDGNHSLATAKVHWQDLKDQYGYNENTDHPARFALVELINLHSDALIFEPIHRIIFNIDCRSFTSLVEKIVGTGNLSFEWSDVSNMTEVITGTYNQPSFGKGKLIIFDKDNLVTATFHSPVSNLEAGNAQYLVDKLMTHENKEIKVDYIHGLDTLVDLCRNGKNTGIILPSMDKNSLFETVVKDGVLPKKTFSMGEAVEKRYYLEARKIVR